MLINTVDGLGATMLNGQPATVQLLSPCFTMATYASIRSHITNRCEQRGEMKGTGVI
jgi:hypothetical protein